MSTQHMLWDVWWKSFWKTKSKALSNKQMKSACLLHTTFHLYTSAFANGYIYSYVIVVLLCERHWITAFLYFPSFRPNAICQQENKEWAYSCEVSITVFFIYMSFWLCERCETHYSLALWMIYSSNTYCSFSFFPKVNFSFRPFNLYIICTQIPIK